MGAEDPTPTINHGLADRPIEVPGSPFWEVARTFGRDELIALLINTFGTAVISGLTTNHAAIAITGPVIEKAGFFVAYLNEAGHLWQTTPPDKREGLRHYISGAIRRGSSSLAKDIAVHDPLYTVAMLYGLQVYPDTPAWMLSTLSFAGAVGVVAAGEVAVNEARYHNRIRKFQRLGFKYEPYLETRFYVNNPDGMNSDRVLRDFSDAFGLAESGVSQYHDRYFETKLSPLNFRTPRFRLRQRDKENGGQMQTVQIAHTRASRSSREKPEQYNYFPVSKHKLWRMLDQEMPWEVADIHDRDVRACCAGITGPQGLDIYFRRSYVRDPDNILVAVDCVSREGADPFTVVEIKSHPGKESIRRLIEAMRYLMTEYSVTQTTHDKRTLVSF